VQWHAGDYALTLLVASIGDVQHYSDVIFHDWQDQLATVSVVPRQFFPLSDMIEPPSDVSVMAQAPWVIVDDFFPHLLTGFRVAEYNAHLHTFPQLQIMSTLGDFSEQYPPYRALYPEHARRVSSYVPNRLAGAALAYITFLNNAHAYLDDITRHSVPFVLNLYPGGGLGLDDAQSDQKLLRVLASPLLKAIIVTQPVVERYLTQLAQAHELRLPPMHMVQGVVVNPDYFDPTLTRHGPRYGQGKDTLDVCFVAESYMPGAANKGFPEFMAAMQRLADLPQLRMHVVGGGYTAAELQAPGLGRPVHHHGRLPTAQLREFYGKMDLIVSPNRPGQLHLGNFDGFPTGACVEAALCEVAVMATDALQQNPGYVDQQSIFLLDHNGEPLPEQIERTVRHLAVHPEQLSQLANACQRLTRTLYAPERQIATRQDILRKAAA
jgi:lipopolysaccharide transport system ATP-binding protein